MLTPKSGPLGRRLAAHLLRRASYNVSKARIDEFANYTVQEAMDVLMTPSTPQYPEPLFWNVADFYPPPDSPPEGSPFIYCGTIPTSCAYYPKQLGSFGNNLIQYWWMNEAWQDTSMLRKLQHFISTCSLPSITPIDFKAYGMDGLTLLEHYAFGSYRALAKKIPVFPGMMALLNVDESTADIPNENFPREFLELYTLGKGEQIGPDNYTSYTEADVVEAAKIFTGFRWDWRWLTNGDVEPNNVTDPDTGIKIGYVDYNLHDSSDKQFSEAFNFATITGAVDAQDMYREVEDFVDLIFDQEHTALYLCRRMYRYFVHNIITPEIETDVIVPLANIFRNSDYNMETTLRTLLSSQHFYGEDQSQPEQYIVGGMVASGLDIILMHLSRLQLTWGDMATSTNDFYDFLKILRGNIHFFGLGMSAFYPPTVAGHHAYYQEPAWSRLWFTSDAVHGRINLSAVIISRIDPDWVSDNISDPYDATTLVRETLELFFPEAPNAERLDYFINIHFLIGMAADDWSIEWSNYQNSGDATEVTLILHNFFRKTLKAIECQLF